MLDKSAVPSYLATRAFTKIAVTDAETGALYGEFTPAEDTESAAQDFVPWLEDTLNGISCSAVNLQLATKGRRPEPVTLWVGNKAGDPVTPLDTLSHMVSRVGVQYVKLLEQTSAARARDTEALGRLTEIVSDTFDTLRGGMEALIEDRRDERRHRLASELQQANSERQNQRIQLGKEAVALFANMLEAHFKGTTTTKDTMSTPNPETDAKARDLFKVFDKLQRKAILNTAKRIAPQVEIMRTNLLKAGIDRHIVTDALLFNSSRAVFRLITHVSQLPQATIFLLADGLSSESQEALLGIAAFYESAEKATKQQVAKAPG